MPIFLDSEDLVDLQELQKRVRNSHNVALLLSKKVLTRPWVLVEVATAVSSNVRVLPVQLLRIGNEFDFPDESFYQSLLLGELLDAGGAEVLRQSGYTPQMVVDALREVFRRISVTYSPHRSAGIRRAELKALLKHCRIRKEQTVGGAALRSGPVDERRGESREDVKPESAVASPG